MASFPHIRRLLPRLLFVVAACTAGSELGSRALDRVRGRPFDAQARRADIEATCRVLSRRTFIPGGHQDQEVVGPDSSQIILSPYSGWEHMKTHPRLVSELEHYQSPEARDTFDICILGGSVAQSFAQVGQRRLVEKLNADPSFQGREIRVHDDACAGYKQPQPLMVLAYLLARGHEPDAVIEIDGFNESALGWSNAKLGANPAYPSLPNWARATNGLKLDPEVLEDLYLVRAAQVRASEFGEWFLASGWWRSSFLAHAGGIRLGRLQRDYVSAFRRYAEGLKERPQKLEVKGPEIPAGPGRRIRSIVRGWEESSISMEALCRARGILYLHVLQPALPDPGSKVLTRTEIERGVAEPDWIEGVERIYPSLRAAGGRLAARGIAFLDATGILRDHEEDVYVDVCHFGEHGNEILAEAIAPALLRAAQR